MPRPALCPDRAEYQQYLQGGLAAEAFEDLTRHLEDCEACARAAQELAVDDPLLGAMREARTAVLEELDSGELDGLMARLVLLPALPNPATAETLDPEQTSTDQPSPDVVKELLDFLAPAVEPDELGRLGGYRVLRVVGAGGMGVVFEAEDPQLRRRVALKAMKPALAASESARKRFLREGQTAAAIMHDHIITIYQVGEDRGIPFLAMQLLEGETLEDRLKREGRLPPEEAVRIGREVAEGIGRCSSARPDPPRYQTGQYLVRGS